MRTIIILTLLLFFGMGSKAQEEKKYNCCFELYGEKLTDKDISVEGVVKYFKEYGEYGIYVEKDEMWSKTEHLFCPPLKNEFRKEGLKVTVKGKRYVGVAKAPFPPKPGAPPGGALFPTCRFRNYTIIKVRD